MSEQDYLTALGRTPSGLFIVTSAANGRQAAFLGSFVQQASFSPLIFSVAVHPERYPYELMSQSKKFGLSLVGENDQILLKKFAKGHGPESDPISEVSFEVVEGVPLLKDALGGAVFEIIDESKPGDHVIVFGQVLAGRLYDAERKPWVHVRKSAKNY